MVLIENELLHQLKHVGSTLLAPPIAIGQLLHLLDQLESCLSRVDQSPSDSILKALSPSKQALISHMLLRHSDTNAQIAVASCLSQILRITAPVAPYEDEVMKEVFQLIVPTFTKLSDIHSSSYLKRVSILQTVAQYQFCALMLDLNCHELLCAMFNHFLTSIRDYHSDDVFSSMEAIMTFVLEESEDISAELLHSLLYSLYSTNQATLSAAHRLRDRVIGNCAGKINPDLLQEIQSSCLDLFYYTEVVLSTCHESQHHKEQYHFDMDMESHTDVPLEEDQDNSIHSVLPDSSLCTPIVGQVFSDSFHCSSVPLDDSPATIFGTDDPSHIVAKHTRPLHPSFSREELLTADLLLFIALPCYQDSYYENITHGVLLSITLSYSQDIFFESIAPYANVYHVLVAKATKNLLPSQGELSMLLGDFCKADELLSWLRTTTPLAKHKELQFMRDMPLLLGYFSAHVLQMTVIPLLDRRDFPPTLNVDIPVASGHNWLLWDCHLDNLQYEHAAIVQWWMTSIELDFTPHAHYQFFYSMESAMFGTISLQSQMTMFSYIGQHPPHQPFIDVDFRQRCYHPLVFLVFLLLLFQHAYASHRRLGSALRHFTWTK